MNANFLSKSINFIKGNKAIVIAVALVILFIYILVVSITATSSQKNPRDPNSPDPTRSSSSGGGPVPTASKDVSIYEPNTVWQPTRFSESSIQNVLIEKTQLNDGSTKYKYQSEDPKRPNELIVKDNEVIYQRTVIKNKYIYNYTNTLGAPDFVFESSKYYGPSTMIYVYLKSGTAFVADDKTTIVKEQLSFKPTSFEQFRDKYGDDIADYKIIPTLPDEDFARP